LTPKSPKTPDFKVSTEYFQVENGNEYRLGDTTDWNYSTTTTPGLKDQATPGLFGDSDYTPSSGILSQGC